MQHCSTLCILYTICPLFGLDSRPQNKKGKISDCSVEKLTCNYLLSAIWPLPFNKVVMCNNQFSPVEQPLTSLFVLSCQPSALQWVEMHILVVGAGPGGLVSGRHVLQLPRERWDTTLTIVDSGEIYLRWCHLEWERGFPSLPWSAYEPSERSDGISRPGLRGGK